MKHKSDGTYDYGAMMKKSDMGYDYGSGAKPTMHGQIASPLEPCGYEITANGGASQKGGEPNGPFGQHMETPNSMMGVGRDSMTGNLGVSGEISTPMDTAKAAMPGVTGSSGTGQTGDGKISTPWSGPFGQSVG